MPGKFVELSSSQISHLIQDNLLKQLPKSAPLYNLAITCLNGNCNDVLKIKLFAYVDDGQIQNNANAGLIVAMVEKTKLIKWRHEHICWTILAPEDKYLTQDMMNAFAGIVKWKKPNIFEGYHPDLTPTFEKMCENHGHGHFRTRGLNPTLYMLEGDSDDSYCNDAITISELNIEGVKKLIHYWKYANEDSFEEIWFCTQRIGSAGVIVNGEFVSWAYVSCGGYVHGLYTLEEHRGKGYAKEILRSLGKILKKKNMFLISGVGQNNLASAKLMLSCGFREIHPADRIYYLPDP